jgi:hypothetical protein
MSVTDDTEHRAANMKWSPLLPISSTVNSECGVPMVACLWAISKHALLTYRYPSTVTTADIDKDIAVTEYLSDGRGHAVDGQTQAAFRARQAGLYTVPVCSTVPRTAAIQRRRQSMTIQVTKLSTRRR